MKILFFLHSLNGGGAERVTVNLANHWAARGENVTIVTLCPSDMDFYPLNPAIERVALDLAGDSANSFQALIANMRRILALRRQLRQKRPDVAIGMMSSAATALGLSACGLKIPVTIGAERIHPPQLPLSAPWQWLRRQTYGLLSGIVALTEESSCWLRGNTRARSIVTIPNAVQWPLPENEPRLSPRSFVSATDRVLLAVGRLQRQKGFDILIEAFAGIANRHSDWSLYIVGEGVERKALEAQIVELGLSGRIILPGPAGNIGDWYNAADLYVCSSRHEGFPNTLLEAMAHGLAVVSFDCETGPRDIVRHEIDGLLVAPEDAHALAVSLERLMSDHKLRESTGKSATSVKYRFSIEVIDKIWMTYFKKMGLL